MIAIDTNVLLRGFVRDDPAQFAAASGFLETLTPERPGFVTHVVLAEAHWLLTRIYKVPRATTLKILHDLVRSRSLEFEDGETVVRALELAEQGADFADALIQGSGELFGVTETVTFDRRAAQRLGWRLLA